MSKQDELKKAISHTIEEYGWCRSITHFWAPNGPIIKSGQVIELNLRCQHCSAIRTTKLDSRGHVINRQHDYKYPKGYLVPGAKITRAQVRTVLFVKQAETIPVEIPETPRQPKTKSAGAKKPE